MIVLCAWCEQEGRPACIADTGPRNRLQSSQSHSHGICDRHQKVLIRQIQNLRRTGSSASKTIAKQPGRAVRNESAAHIHH